MGAGIEVPVGVKGGAFRRGLAAMRNEVDSFKKSVANPGPLSNMGARLGSLFAFGSIVAGFQRMLDYGGRIQDLADRFRVTAEEVQRVGNVAELSGVDIETVAKAMFKLGSAANKAAHGDVELAASFDLLKINAKEFRDLGVEGKLIELSRAYQAAGDDGSQVAAVMELLGGRAQQLLPMLAAGPDALKKQFAEQKVMSDETIAQLDAIGDAYTNLKNKAIGALDQVIKGMKATGAWVGWLINRFSGVDDADQIFTDQVGEIYLSKAEKKEGNAMLNLDEFETAKAKKSADPKHATQLEKMRSLAAKREAAQQSIVDLDEREARLREQAEGSTGDEAKQFGESLNKIAILRAGKNGEIADLEGDMLQIAKTAGKNDGGKVFASQLAAVGGGGLASVSSSDKHLTMLSEIKNYLRDIRDAQRSSEPREVERTPAFSGQLQSGSLQGGRLRTGGLRTGRL